jgi:hypothetical protein
MMNEHIGLSYNTRKAISVQLGESAANELATVIERMAREIEELKSGKVSVTPVVPNKKKLDPIAALDNETF